MIFFNLLINFQCTSILKHGTPLSNYKLISISLLTRHGIRTPLYNWKSNNYSGFWTCESEDSNSPRMNVINFNNFSRRYFYVMDSKYVSFPPSCNEGELLLTGMYQHGELGKFYRKYLIDELNFLPFNLNSNLLNIRSSNVDRCIKSLESFLIEFYPPEKPNEKLNIITGTPNNEPLYPDYDQCEELQIKWLKFKNSIEFQNKMNYSKNLYKKVYEDFNINFDDTNWMFIGDWLSSYYCSNQELPSWVTEELFNQSQIDMAYYSIGFFKFINGIAGSSIWREIIKNIDLQLNNTIKSIYHHYSAHDSTLMALLNTINYNLEILPPFGSHLAIELWQKNNEEPLIKIIYNGEEIPLNINGNKLMKFKDFKSLYSQLIYSHCNEFP